MNIEEHGFCWSAAFYWVIVAILALLLFLFAGNTPQNNGGLGSGGGNGMGSGSVPGGLGDGAGYGDGASKTGTGSGDGENPTGTGETNAPTAEKQPQTSSTDASKGSAPTGSATSAPAEESSAPPVSTARPFALPKNPPPAPSPAAGGREKGFFGVDVVRGGRVIFLVDTSTSMGNGTNEGISRLELLKKELLKIIAQMSPQNASGDPNQKRSILGNPVGKFRIASFNSCSTLAPMAGKPIWSFGKKADVAAAQQFISKMSSSGNTRMMHAWQELEATIKADRITAVYFLSDGEPNDCSKGALLNYLKQKYPKLVIHTFSMGHASGLMKKIADQHHGKYVEIY